MIAAHKIESKNIKNEKPDIDMILFEFTKKQIKLRSVFETLSDMSLIQIPQFNEIKYLIFEGIEKLKFIVKLREFQLSNHNNVSTSNKHETIVKNILKSWEQKKIIGQNESQNTGAFYSRIDHVEDFLFEACNQVKESINNLPKEQAFEEIMLTLDYFIAFFEILKESNGFFHSGSRNEYEGFLSYKKTTNNNFGSNILIEKIVSQFLSMFLRDSEKISLIKIKESFSKKYRNLCNYFCFLKITN